MKIIQYCQHVLGIGHLFRSLEISRALSDHEVILVSGGPPVDINLPKHVTEFRLPELHMDGGFKGLFSAERPAGVEQVKEERQKRLFALLAAEEPDVFLIELYPFGRKAFRFELDPVLQAVDDKRISCGSVVCSVRDILVEKEDRDKHELRAVKTLNRYFDTVLVHADPQLVKISETFDHFNQIAIPVDYTGYIAPKPSPDAGKLIRRQLKIDEKDILIIASAGGGNVGAPLLTAAVQAFSRLAAKSRSHMNVFTGPFLDQREFERLKKGAGSKVRITRFSKNFLSHLAAANLSISMGGYNTTMNILASTVPALVWPFGRNREQRLRAERLAKLGAVRVLDDEALHPDRLAAIMDEWISRSTRSAVDINLDGAANTARWIETAMER